MVDLSKWTFMAACVIYNEISKTLFSRLYMFKRYASPTYTFLEPKSKATKSTFAKNSWLRRMLPKVVSLRPKNHTFLYTLIMTFLKKKYKIPVIILENLNVKWKPQKWNSANSYKQGKNNICNCRSPDARMCLFEVPCPRPLKNRPPRWMPRQIVSIAFVLDSFAGAKERKNRLGRKSHTNALLSFTQLHDKVRRSATAMKSQEVRRGKTKVAFADLESIEPKFLKSSFNNEPSTTLAVSFSESRLIRQGSLKSLRSPGLWVVASFPISAKPIALWP